MLPIISVIITTYNHEKYIAQAIESVLMQTDCPSFEIIVVDDCSTDSTSVICEDYMKKFPDIIKFHRNNKNLGMLHNMKNAFSACCGQYIAICEGDDYWIDKHKLKKQYTELQKNPKASFCFTDFFVNNEFTGKIVKHIPIIKHSFPKKYTIKEQIEYGGAVGNFSSCMFPKESLSFIPESYYEHKGNADWLFFLYFLDKSDGIFIKDKCSVYRLHSGSQYSSLDLEKKVMLAVENCLYYNELFDSRYIHNFWNYFYLLFSELHNSHSNTHIKSLFIIKFPVSSTKTLSVELKRIKSLKNGC